MWRWWGGMEIGHVPTGRQQLGEGRQENASLRARGCE